MPLANKLPGVLRRPLRFLWRQALVPFRGRMRASENDLAARVPFGFAAIASAPSSQRIAVVCHMFHEDLAMAFRRTMDNLPSTTDVYMSTDVDSKVPAIRRAFATWGQGTDAGGSKVDIRVLPNRGRDIGPKLVGFADVYSQYDLILFLHSKKSLTSSLGNDWRDMLLNTLVGSPANVSSILSIFDRHPQIGIVCAQHFEPIRGLLHWDGNFPPARDLARRMGFKIKRSMTLDFPSGSMFWARPSALMPLLDLKLTAEDFPVEMNQVRGTPQHAVERLFFLVAEHAGYSWVKVAHGSNNDHAVRSIPDPAAVDTFVSEARLDLLPCIGSKR